MNILELDLSIIPMVIDMQQNGIRIDVDHFNHLTEKFTQEAHDLNNQIDAIYGHHVEPDSTKQVARMFYDLGIYDTPDRSTDKDNIEMVLGDHPVVVLIKDYRNLTSMISKGTRKLPKMVDSDGRIRCDIQTTRAPTGRLAAKNPNMMAVDKRMYGGFIPRDGHVLVEIDYGGIEMRTVAHVAQCPVMMKLFWNDGDIHDTTAIKYFGEGFTKEQRSMMKAVGFGTLYGIGKFGLYNQFITAKIKKDDNTNYTEDDCQSLIDEWFRTYPGVYRWTLSNRSFIRRNGYAVDMWGRRVLIPEVYSVHTNTQNEGYRRGGNHPIQAGAQGIIKSAMRDLTPIYKDLQSSGVSVHPLLQVHDSLLWEIEEPYWRELAEYFADVMTNAVQLDVPIKCDIEFSRQSWGQMKGMKDEA